MNSWMKEEHVPIWWPPKMDDEYDEEDSLALKLTITITGWLMFVFIWGTVIFILVFVWRLLGII